VAGNHQSNRILTVEGILGKRGILPHKYDKDKL
jgi:hypothetical protein